jgi:hypothetical protein
MGLLTPLQLTAGSALLNNTGLVLGADLQAALTAYSSTSLIAAWQAAVNNYLGQSWKTEYVLAGLLSIGSGTVPALGNSIPSGAPTPRPIAGPVTTGFSGLIADTGNLYLGNGDIGKFALAFMAAQGYINSTNVFVNSAVNAQTYLGPTFTNMSNLTTNNISAMNSNLTGFGVDLGNQGQLTDMQNLNNYGTPAALLKQISKVAGLQGGTLRIIEVPLVAAGLSKDNILMLISGSRDANPAQFDQYQRLAYTGMTNVVGVDLQQVLSILDVTTPNISTLADLLDQKKIFPNSWTTLATPTANGPALVYQDNGSANFALAAQVAAYLPTASGCEELGKVIPPGQAVANKAVQVGFQQITGIASTTLPKLAQTVLGQCKNVWSANKIYLANSCVANGQPIPTYYRAQQDVPAGIDINNTDYWLPTSLGGISTMAGLPDIQAQTTALPASASDYYANDVAVGTGPNGTLTTCDIFGAAVGSGYNSYLESAAATINAMASAGALAAIQAQYVNLLYAIDDGAMLAHINLANIAISNFLSAYPAEAAVLNTAWSAMAAKLAEEKSNQTNAGISLDDLPDNDKTSVYGFVQNLTQYGLQVDACGASDFLDQVADLSVIGGQAIVGAMREARNNQRLDAAQLSQNATPSTGFAVTPVPAVVPVN